MLHPVECPQCFGIFTHLVKCSEQHLVLNPLVAPGMPADGWSWEYMVLMLDFLKAAEGWTLPLHSALAVHSAA